MKDGAKTISERATRFLPVDMKDRLKSAFNRNPATPPAEPAPVDDTPDYSAIFNANRAAAAEKNSRFTGPLLNGPLDKNSPDRNSTDKNLAEKNRSSASTGSAGAKNGAATISDDIEDAEIVAEASEDASPGAGLDYSALLKSEKFRTTKSKPSRVFEENGAEAMLDEADSVFKADAKPVREEAEPQSAAEAPDANSNHEDAVSQKSKSRFFGEFASTESVRLKVEKRGEKPPAPPPILKNGNPSPQPESSAPEVTVVGAERGATPVFAMETEPMSTTVEEHAATIESVVAPTQATETAHINLLEEYASMDAKEHESGNGAAVQSESSSSVAAIAIERNSKFSGQLKFAGTITIEGQVEGELIAERIVVHEGGVVNASIDGNLVVIAGTVKGDVRAHTELEILASGMVDGAVTAPAITVRRGARVEGRCTIGVPRQ